MTESPQKKLGRILRARREALGVQKWTQQYVADVTGLAQTTISAWETGKVRRPRIETLGRIAIALGIDLNDLVSASEHADIAHYIADLKEMQALANRYSGSRAEVVRLLDELTEENVDLVLSHTRWVRDRQEGEDHPRVIGAASPHGTPRDDATTFGGLRAPLPVMA